METLTLTQQKEDMKNDDEENKKPTGKTLLNPLVPLVRLSRNITRGTPAKECQTYRLSKKIPRLHTIHTMSYLPHASSLTSLYSGVSTSALKDATEWRSTLLLFTPVSVRTEGGGEKIALEIKGRGKSLWRGMFIEFNVTGLLYPPKYPENAELEEHEREEWGAQVSTFILTKQHIGKYTNSVKYAGVLEKNSDGSGGVRWSFSGSYPNGIIELTQTETGAEPPRDLHVMRSIAPPSSRLKRLLESLLSGVEGWEGKSISRTQDTTKWVDVKINFHVKSGDGLGLWADICEFFRAAKQSLEFDGERNAYLIFVC